MCEGLHFKVQAFTSRCKPKHFPLHLPLSGRSSCVPSFACHAINHTRDFREINALRLQRSRDEAERRLVRLRHLRKGENHLTCTAGDGHGGALLQEAQGAIILLHQSRLLEQVQRIVVVLIDFFPTDEYRWLL